VGGDTSRVKGSGASRSVKRVVAKDDGAAPGADLARSPGGAAKAASRGQDAVQPPAGVWWKRPGTIAVAVGAAVALVMLAGIILAVRTPDGTIVLENLPDDAEVTVDGSKVTLKSSDGMTFEVRVDPGKEHRLEVKVGDVRVFGENVEVAAGGRKSVVVRREEKGQQAPPPKPTKPEPPPVARRFPFDIWNRQIPSGWRIEGDELVQGSSSDVTQAIHFGDPNWTDYDFSADAKIMEGRPGCELNFRRVNDWKNYHIALDGASKGLLVRATWTANGPAVPPVLKPMPIEKGKWYHAEVRVRGKHLDVYIDEQKVFSDDRNDLPPNGRVGLATWASSCRFRNIVVRDPKGAVLLEGLPDLDGVKPATKPPGDPPKPNGARANDPAETAGIARQFTNAVGMKLVRVPGTRETYPAAGTFTMGSPVSETQRHPQWRRGEDQHQVEISPFHLGVYEVKQREFREVMGYNPSYFSTNAGGKAGVRYGENQPGGGKGLIPPGDSTEDYPAENVSWDEAREFCEKLTARDTKKPAGWVYRLPTEAEWEYACRGGTPSYQTFAFGNTIGSTQANLRGEGPWPWEGPKGPDLKRTCTVGSYRPNGFGLYDMHGNVWEWCGDWWAESYYRKSPWKDPTGPAEDTGGKVARGGSWNLNGWDCRSACRGLSLPLATRGNYIGFRVALVPPGR
jgi:formylglycine-generating enzyme required for sulfatase activity